MNAVLERIGGSRIFGRKAPQILAPPILEEAIRFPYGPFKFKARLPKGVFYTVQTCTDLRSWQSLSSGVAGETFEYLDSEAARFSYRFYRLQVEEIYSANVVGYVAVMLPPGFSMIANPLDSASSTVEEMFKNWPDGTSLNRFDTRFFQ